MSKSNELQIGKAGEYLVCADVIIMGMIAYPSEQGLPYDVVIDNGTKLLKCQVKTTEKGRRIPQRANDNYAYGFNIKRHGKNGTERYTKSDVDIFALVELENRTVIYVIPDDMPDTVFFRKDHLKGMYYDEKGIKQHKECTKFLAEGLSIKQIAEKMKLHYSAVYRMTQKDFVPHVTKARYWSDYKRTKEWFSAL